ncbi:hypothetical protein ACH5RR_027591 [Cinchona calisaya]|uniref:HMG box domain-containing protein n=1 Tax=Cinchona calisaya TaxID=153742 RepID=A0ABD2Z5W4_9GENT
MKGGKSKTGSESKLGVKRGKQKREKKAKDPNKPKRPPTAFLIFMEGFRKQFKEKNPESKSVAAVSKAGGGEWKSLTEEEKASYKATADKRKQEYDRQMQAYNRRLEGGHAEEESDKSKSEVNDEDEGSGEEEDDE